MHIEELQGPFDTIIRRCRQVAQDLEGEGKNDEAEKFWEPTKALVPSARIILAWI